jgi:glycosyltransferase involved in cell wall biosynthesis
VRIAYISFDTVPASKGAATHIAAFARALAGAFGTIDLVTVGSAETHTVRWPGVIHTEFPAMGQSLIDRVLCFRACLARWLAARTFDVVQFRSIFEGMPLLRLAPRPRLVFEVNGLPSIELKYRYPRAADDRELMAKIVAQEQACLTAADCVVTPSLVTAAYLLGRRGVDRAKIRVIPNGVDPDLFHPCEMPRADLRLLYFGTLAPWQGVDLAVRAAAQAGASLAIFGAASGRQTRPIVDLAAKLGIAERVTVAGAIPQEVLVQELHRAFAVLAPLSLNDRNLVQGCCPLKILEGMAAGVPVIASDLPVVRELGQHGRDFLLVKANSVDQLAAAVRQLQDDPQLWRSLAAYGRARVLERFTWELAGRSLVSAYESYRV